MIKLILDTNVLVSASIAKGHSRRIATDIIIDDNGFETCLSENVIEEYSRVSAYHRIKAKYPHFSENVTEIIAILLKNSTLYYPVSNIFLLKDLSDNIFLELAKEANADYLITGNHLDFTITEFENTKIISPKTFCELYDKGQL